MTVDEAAQLAAQLPMLVRGIYYDGWEPTRVPVKMDKDEFLARVRKEFPYDIRGSLDELVQTVLQALRSYITEGEWQDIKSSMPKDLATAFP